MLSKTQDAKLFVLAQGEHIVPVHFVHTEDEAARSVCGLNPESGWARVWREPIDMREMPNGVCRECWHSTRFAETFAAALQ